MTIGELYVKIQAKYRSDSSLYEAQLKSERSWMKISITLMKWALQWA